VRQAVNMVRNGHAGGGIIHGPMDRAASSRGILDSWKDLLLFIATPIVIVPLAIAAKSHLSLEEIALYVAAFGAVGHHLPGMLRAYADRELFKRFKLRFLLSPLFLLTVCVLFELLSNLVLLVNGPFGKGWLRP
jgi:hypothetical protein